MNYISKSAIILIFIFSVVNLISSDEIKFTGVDNFGTEFLLTFHPNWSVTGKKSDVLVYVYSEYNTEVTLSIEAADYSETKTVEPFQTIQFKVPALLAQAFIANNKTEPQQISIWEDKAIIVKSKEPIACYGVSDFTASSEGFLVLPIHTLGKNYLVSSFRNHKFSDNAENMTAYVSIIGCYDDTDITFQLVGNSISYFLDNNEQAVYSGGTLTRTLDKGDILLVPVLGNLGDLTGSLVNADKPVAVISGHFNAHIPRNSASGSYLIEQEFPAVAWGNQYNIPALPNRTKATWINVLSKENAVIYRDGQLYGTIKAVANEENDGYISQRYLTESEATKPISIWSESPIYVTQFNTSAEDDFKDSNPFQMQILPKNQYANEIVFSLPNTSFNLPENKDNYLTLCYLGDDEGNFPDDFMVGEYNGNSFTWTKANVKWGGAGTKVLDSTGLRYFYTKNVKLDNPTGVYKIKADEPFAAYISGWNINKSYGYPAFARFSDKVSFDVTPPNFYADNEKPIITGRIADDISPSSRFAYIYLNSINSENFALTHDDFIPGEVNKVNFTLEAIDKMKYAKAEIQAIDRVGQIKTENFEYFPPKFKNEFIDGEFGEYILGSELVTKKIKITNHDSSFTNLNLQDIKINDENGVFKIVDFEPTNLFFPNEFVVFKISFNPYMSAGLFKADVFITTMDYDYFAMSIDAKVVEGGTLKAEDIAFEPTPIFQTSIKTLNLTNTGDYPVKVESVSWIAESPFEVNTDFPITIESNDITTIEISFTPTEIKYYSADLIINSNAVNDASAFIEGEGIKGAVLFADDLYFNDVKVGNTATSSIQLKNNGDTELIITDAEFTENSAFSIDENSFPINIPELQTEELTVEFSPSVIRNYADSLIFISNSNQIENESREFSIIYGNSISTSVEEVENSELKIKSVINAQNNLELEIEAGKSEAYTLEINDLQGKILLTKEIKLQSGLNKYQLAYSGKANTFVFITIKSNSIRTTKKVIL